MTRRWTFGQRIAAAFAVMVILTVVVGVISVVALDNVVSSKDDVIDRDARVLIDTQAVTAAANQESSAVRGFLLTGSSVQLERKTQAADQIDELLPEIRQLVPDAETGALVDKIEESEAAYRDAIDTVIASKQAGGSIEAVAQEFEALVQPARDQLRSDTDALIAKAEQNEADARDASSDTASSATTIVIVVAALSVVVAAILAFVLARSLRRLVGTTVGEVRSSSAELQATANQQATGAREQATAMNEITTTISELLATSRQIAESAQRVAQVAEQTAGAGRSGEDTVTRAQESMADIRRQVDVIVDHMLELGDKSQQIGAVLDIVSELAEQTNILAINSTIEAAGAGESGRRFAVVADEIRKLADRVAASTKEIRGLIDVVRGAVNTTVMATEIGSKAVDAGTKEVADVATSFGEIAELVGTTTEAAREIELSTKQQASAVEQVNVAMTDVAQATKETETSSTQTLATASQLNDLSKELQLLVESHASE